MKSLILFFFFFSVFCAFIVHFFIDLDFQILPNGVNLYLAIVFLSYSLFFHPWPHWLWGGILGFSIPYSITWVFYKLRGKIGMGGGDIKLYGALGLYLGPEQIVVTLFLSCFLGSLAGLIFIGLRKMKRETPMAFGPFIIIAASLQIFFPHFQKYLMTIVFQ
ncbi:MAG: A24 family peptidase [Bacteriovoracales bacterium]|nr:A24 family peptidase [Bacteriovoracales bacterium]